jgi:WD40 repeat protein
MTATTVPHAVPGVRVFGDPQLHADGDLLALAFAPDGTLWSVEEPGIVRHWKPDTGQELAWHSPSDLEDLWAFSHDARFLASASNDLSLWDTESGNLLTALPQPDWVTALAFAPDTTHLATGHDDGTVRYWDAAAHQRLRQFGPHKLPVSALAFRGDGKLLASAGEDKVIGLWDVTDGSHAGTLVGHTDRIPALVWHPDGRHLISAGWDTTARIWDTQTQQPVILLNSHAAQVTALALSRDGQLLACADSDNAVHVWDFAARKTLHVLKGTAQDIRCLAFSADGKRLAFGGGDRVIHLWDPHTGQPVSSQSLRARSLTRLALSPDGTRLASNGGGAAPRVWDVATRQPALSLHTPEVVHALAWSPDGRVIAGGTDRHICLWDAATGQTRQLLEDPEEPTTVLAFAPDAATLASGGSAALPVWLHRVADGEPVLLIPDPLQHCTVSALAFHPHRPLLAVGGIDWLATGGSDGAVALWDISTRAEVATFFGGTTAVAFDPAGKRLACASLDRSIQVYDVDSEQLIVELMGHEGAASCVAWSPDGSLLASGGEDRTVRLWDPATGDELAARELDTQVQALSFAPDGQQLFTGNGNTTCYAIALDELLNPSARS